MLYELFYVDLTKDLEKIENKRRIFEMKTIIKRIHEKGKSILISSHILQDMDEICTNIAIVQNGCLTYNKEIESCYIVRTGQIASQVLALLSNDFSFTVNEERTALTVKINREQVPQLLRALETYHIDVYEIAASNVKGIVQEQLQLREVQG